MILAGKRTAENAQKLVEEFKTRDKGRVIKIDVRVIFGVVWAVREAMTYITMYSYNFCWPVCTLREKVEGCWRPRSPAKAAGLAEHVWSMREWLTFPIDQRS